MPNLTTPTRGAFPGANPDPEPLGFGRDGHRYEGPPMVGEPWTPDDEPVNFDELDGGLPVVVRVIGYLLAVIIIAGVLLWAMGAKA